jgi:hypothetical protein
LLLSERLLQKAAGKGMGGAVLFVPIVWLLERLLIGGDSLFPFAQQVVKTTLFAAKDSPDKGAKSLRPALTTLATTQGHEDNCPQRNEPLTHAR